MVPWYYVEYVSLMPSLCHETSSRMLTASLADKPMFEMNILLKCSSVLLTEVSIPAGKRIIPPFSFLSPSFLPFFLPFFLFP